MIRPDNVTDPGNLQMKGLQATLEEVLGFIRIPLRRRKTTVVVDDGINPDDPNVIIYDRIMLADRNSRHSNVIRQHLSSQAMTASLPVSMVRAKRLVCCWRRQ